MQYSLILYWIVQSHLFIVFTKTNLHHSNCADFKILPIQAFWNLCSLLIDILQVVGSVLWIGSLHLLTLRFPPSVFSCLSLRSSDSAKKAPGRAPKEITNFPNEPLKNNPFFVLFAARQHPWAPADNTNPNIRSYKHWLKANLSRLNTVKLILVQLKKQFTQKWKYSPPCHSKPV